MGAAMPCRCARRTISPLKKSVSTLPVLRLNDCQVELLAPVFRPGTGRGVGPSARAAVDISNETNSIPASRNTCSPSARSAATTWVRSAPSVDSAPAALARLLNSLLYFQGATSSTTRIRMPAADVELTDPRPRPHDHLTGFEVHGRQPDADTEDPAEIAQRFLFGGNAVERGQHWQQIACRPEDTVRTVDRLIHPLLQRHVELLSFGGEDQHGVGSQSQMFGTLHRLDRRVECAVGRSQCQARGRQ